MKSNFDLKIDLHGLREDEAIRRVNNLLFAGSSSKKSILIIHGCGSGILRSAVRRCCKNCQLVAEVWNGEDFNLPGLDGVTAVFVR